jgi:hypothetical protein
MLKRMALEDSEAESVSSGSMSSEFETLKLEMSPGTPAMSAVFPGPDRTDTSSTSESRSSRSRESSEATQSSGSKFSFTKRSSSHGSIDRQRKKEDSLARWLSHGTVIYKSVGLGLMDLAVGMHLIKVAAEKGMGIHIDNFS